MIEVIAFYLAVASATVDLLDPRGLVVCDDRGVRVAYINPFKSVGSVIMDNPIALVCKIAVAG